MASSAARRPSGRWPTRPISWRHAKPFVTQVHIEPAIVTKIQQIMDETRPERTSIAKVKQLVELGGGASPRAGINIVQAARVHAVLQGNDFVGPNDIAAVIPHILRHRLVFQPGRSRAIGSRDARRRNHRRHSQDGFLKLDAKEILREVRRSPVKFIPGKPAVSIFPGEWPSPFEGKGFEPRRFRDFQLGDNPRHINLPVSTRRGTPTIIERVALRDVKIMVVLDRSPSMLVRDKLETQFAAAALILYSAWQSETTFGLAIRDGMIATSYGLGIGSRHFFRTYAHLCRVFEGDKSGKAAGTVAPLGQLLPSNAMMLYCSDFLEDHGGLVELNELWRTVRRYDFVPVVIQDALEYSFPVMEKGSFISFQNPETRRRDEIWVSRQRADDIRKLHEARFELLKGTLGRWGLRCIHLDTPNVQDVGKRIDRFFRQRKLR